MTETIASIAIRDARPDVDAFLVRHGNPFERVGLDARSTMQFYLGSSGVPESYIVDGKGIIRYKQIGPVNADVLAKTIVPLVRRLQQS